VAANDLHTTATASPTDGGIVNAVYADGLIQERQISQETASEDLRGHHQETVFVHETDAFTATADIKSPFSWGDIFILSSIATDSDSNLSNFRLRTKKWSFEHFCKRKRKKHFIRPVKTLFGIPVV